jgi:hypothetical protein
VNRLANFLAAIGFIYMVFFVVSIFVTKLQEPLVVLISKASLNVFGGDVDNELWTVIGYKITDFAYATSFLLLGTYISYY